MFLVVDRSTKKICRRGFNTKKRHGRKGLETFLEKEDLNTGIVVGKKGNWNRFQVSEADSLKGLSTKIYLFLCFAGRIVEA